MNHVSHDILGKTARGLSDHIERPRAYWTTRRAKRLGVPLDALHDRHWHQHLLPGQDLVEARNGSGQRCFARGKWRPRLIWVTCRTFALILACLGTANALTPPLDNSPGFFAGEWAGHGGQGSYCYLKLSADGWGWVLIDGGSGDWQGARMQWRNRQQALQVVKIIPLAASAQLRIMPLEKFALNGGFNQSLRLNWNEQSGSCQMQKIETTARQLVRARGAIEALPPGERMR